MSKLSNCIQFQSKITLKSMLWFFGIYFAIYFALFLMFLALVNASPTSSASMQSGFFIAGAIFIFVYVAASYKPHFNFLLMFGNTRRNIFLSSVIVYAVLSLINTVISIISQFLDNAFTNELSRVGRHSENLLNMMYKNNVSIASEFLWYLMLLVMVYSLAMLYGAMAYRYGRIFITIFWVGFSLSWTALPIMSGINGGTVLVNALNAYFCTGTSYGILLAPINFAITAVIFFAAAYVLSTHQSQVA